jgi:hypothetical protein
MPTGVFGRVRDALAAVACTFRGHVPELRATGTRIWLQCPACAHTTPGWTLDGPAPRLRFHGDPARFRSYAWTTASSPIDHA